MSNIYIYFETEAERRAFTQKVIEYNHIFKGNEQIGSKSVNSKETLDLMEIGKAESPYYNLFKQFYRGEVPEVKEVLSIYHPIEVFKRGFRSIYYMNSHKKKNGKWLVIQLRNTAGGKKIQEYIKENVDEKLMDSDKSAEEEQVTLKKADDLLQLIDSLEGKLREGKSLKKDRLNILHKRICDMDNFDKKLSNEEKIHASGRAAAIFYTENFMDNMEKCLRIQHKFQPESSDAFLNMGIFYQNRGNIDKAIKSYQEGLSINPKDEDINFRLSLILNRIGYTKYALAYAKVALVQNPNNELNYILIGDIYFKENNLRNALEYYINSLKVMNNETDEAIIFGCRKNIIICCLRLGLNEKAKEEIVQAIVNFKERIEEVLSLINDEETKFGLLMNSEGQLHYRGQLKNNKMYGIGILYDTDSEQNTVSYIGEIQEGRFDGYGCEYYKNGWIRYEGYWKDNKWHGYGKVFYEGGNVMYEGTLKKGCFSGNGVKYSKDGFAEYNGQWLNGKKHGRGIEYSDNGTAKFIGEFYSGKRRGTGKLYDDKGYLKTEVKY